MISTKKRAGSAITMQDIGRELGLSAMTVSRVLSGHPDVKEETREKVQAFVEKRNYRPNRWARSLVTQRSAVIGIVIPDITHSYFSEITRGVQDTIEQHGYDLMLCHTHNVPHRERSALEMLLGSRADGLVVASGWPEEEPGLFRELQKQHVPLVLVDRFFPQLDCPCVRADDEAVGRMAVEHLLSLGHRRIAHIGGPRITSSRLRRQAYTQTMEAHGLAVRPEWMAYSDFSFEGGYRAMKELLLAKERPTAVFAGNDPAAVGAIRACREAGLAVPQDISLIGSGSIEGAYHPCPFLTTVDWPQRELGMRAAELLIERIGGNNHTAEPALFAPRLLQRESTATPAS